MTFVKFNPNKTTLLERGAEAPNEELQKSYDESTYAWQPGLQMPCGTPNKLRITKSSLGNYGWCPYAYKMNHIYKLRQEENEDMVKQVLDGILKEFGAA